MTTIQELLSAQATRAEEPAEELREAAENAVHWGEMAPSPLDERQELRAEIRAQLVAEREATLDSQAVVVQGLAIRIASRLVRDMFRAMEIDAAVLDQAVKFLQFNMIQMMNLDEVRAQAKDVARSMIREREDIAKLFEQAAGMHSLTALARPEEAAHWEAKERDARAYAAMVRGRTVS
jgi:hypothetical protein